MNYNVFSIVSTIIVIIILLFCFKKKNEFNINISNKNYYFMIFFIFIICMFASLYKFGELPYGYHIDEAGMAYDAWSIANYGVDRYLYPYPVYFINFGGGQNSLYGYLAAIFIKAFGLSIYTIRIPAIIFRIITFASLFSISKNNKLLSLIILSLFSICPFFVLSSRWALESYLMYGMLTLAIALMLKALNTQKLYYFIFSSLAFGLTLYTYAISYITVPIILLGILIYALYNQLIKIKHIIIVSCIILIIATPLILVLAVNNGLINEIISFISIPKFHEYRVSEVYIGHINDNLYMLLSLFTQDNQSIFNEALLYNGFAPYYTLYLVSIPFFILGFILKLLNIYKMKFKNCLLDYTMIVWFFSSLFSILIIVDPNINKANAIFIPIIYFITLGIIFAISRIKYLIYALILVYSINFLSFYNYYLNDYTELNKFSYLFSTTYDEALKYAIELESVNTIYSDDQTAEPYIYPHLYYEISPYKFNKEIVFVEEINKTFIYHIPEEIDYDAAYIVHVTWAENYNKEIPNNKTLHYEVFLDKAVVWFE